MSRKIKVKYIGNYYNRLFKRNQIYDATICIDNSKIIIIKDKNGDEYGYPVAEFEIVAD